MSTTQNDANIDDRKTPKLSGIHQINQNHKSVFLNTRIEAETQKQQLETSPHQTRKDQINHHKHKHIYVYVAWGFRNDGSVPLVFTVLPNCHFLKVRDCREWLDTEEKRVWGWWLRAPSFSSFVSLCILTPYILPYCVNNEYVICNGCKSPDTILSKENRLFFLRCEQCGSNRSVAPIKAGFVARVGRRKAGT
ncbi:hypothetical protein L1049_007769 [Liquidambar formosana]|uniref:Translation initiation factor IF2/IF5 domain-containing protein n=1 Tax=Liquidambar formosana TaxID=63359 RepID=A0AAP0X4Y6_LIQFO